MPDNLDSWHSLKLLLFFLMHELNWSMFQYFWRWFFFFCFLWKELNGRNRLSKDIGPNTFLWFLPSFHVSVATPRWRSKLILWEHCSKFRTVRSCQSNQMGQWVDLFRKLCRILSFSSFVENWAKTKTLKSWIFAFKSLGKMTWNAAVKIIGHF